MLQHLVANRNRVVTKDELLQTVWPGLAVEENNLSQGISALRKTFGDTRRDGHAIATIPGVGYQYVGPVEELVRPAGATPEKRSGWRKVAMALGFSALVAVLIVGR